MLDFLKSHQMSIAVSLSSALSGLVLIFGNHSVYPELPSLLLMLFLTLYAAIVCLFQWNSALKKYHTPGCRISIALISVYAAFASWGQRLFLLNDKELQVRFSAILWLFFGAVWFVSIVFALLYTLEFPFHRAVLKPLRRPKRRRIKLILFLLFCTVQLILLYSYWPGTLETESISWLQQAVGGTAIHDTDPVFLVLCMRLLDRLTGSAFMFIGIQMICGAWLLTEYFMIAWDFDAPSWLLAILGILFLLLPNQIMCGITLNRELPHAFTLLWATLLLIRLHLNESLWKRPSFVLSAATAIFLMWSFQPAHPAPAVIFGLICIIKALRHPLKATEKRRQRLRLLCAPVAAGLLIAIVQGPVYTSLHVTHAPAIDYLNMLDPASVCIYQKKDLSKNTDAILEKALPLTKWNGESYFRYGRQFLADSEETLSDITLSDALSVYTDVLLHHPTILLKDRLDSTDILWNVTMAPDAYNKRYQDHLPSSEAIENYVDLSGMQKKENAYITHTGIADCIRQVADASSGSVGDLLLWRAGAYMILFLVLLVFWHANHLNLFVTALPIIAALLGTAAFIRQQSFLLVYPIQLMTVALTFISVCMFRRPSIRKPATDDSRI